MAAKPSDGEYVSGSDLAGRRYSIKRRRGPRRLGQARIRHPKSVRQSHRPAQQVALRAVKSRLPDQLQLLARLRAFRVLLHVQLMGQLLLIERTMAALSCRTAIWLMNDLSILSLLARKTFRQLSDKYPEPGVVERDRRTHPPQVEQMERLVMLLLSSTDSVLSTSKRLASAPKYASELAAHPRSVGRHRAGVARG